MSNKHPEEQVLAIPTRLAKSLAPKVFASVPVNIERMILANQVFLERKAAELDLNHKQVIPYVMVTCEESYLLSQRTDKQEEKRLHNLFSLGQGGHINELDFNGTRSPLIEGLMREIREEFQLAKILDCSPIGIINDNSNPVGRVHLGLVYRVEVDSRNFKVAEEGKHIAQWYSTLGLSAFYDRMENWSKILMDHVIRPVA